jgi:hypothetical protein
MKKLLVGLAAVLGLSPDGKGQDLAWLVEQAPMISMVLVQVLAQAPSFSAKVQVHVSGNADPDSSDASGTLEFQKEGMRWEAKLADITAAQLTANARSVVRQINGDQFLLLTRADQKANYLILSGAQCYLEGVLPALKLSRSKEPAGEATLQGHPCSKELLTAVRADGATNEVVVWRAKDLKSPPLQVQITDAGEFFRIRFTEAHFRTIPADRFQIPQNLAKYNSVEDLLQSVLLEKMKKRMGLQ